MFRSYCDMTRKSKYEVNISILTLLVFFNAITNRRFNVNCLNPFSNAPVSIEMLCFYFVQANRVYFFR